ncbi:MAG TPA: molybdopterin molybdenumtransferase MoeA, partial [Thermoanaerobaculia bacterium]
MPSSFGTVRPGERMLEVEEAQERVLAEVRVLGAERIGITEALGRILRESVVSPRDVPRADNSAMDGYAVRSADVPGALRVVEDVPAGVVARERVEPGTAIRIMTGAEIPAGSDCVAPVEITDAGSPVVTVSAALRAGENIRR